MEAKRLQICEVESVLIRYADSMDHSSDSPSVILIVIDPEKFTPHVIMFGFKDFVSLQCDRNLTR